MKTYDDFKNFVNNCAKQGSSRDAVYQHIDIILNEVKDEWIIRYLDYLDTTIGITNYSNMAYTDEFKTIMCIIHFRVVIPQINQLKEKNLK
jgi:hypothetical protein